MMPRRRSCSTCHSREVRIGANDEPVVANVWSADLTGMWCVEVTDFPLPRQGGDIAVVTPPN